MGEESKIEKKAKLLAFNELGIISSKLVTPGHTGFPDDIFWLPGGKPLLIEFKRPGEVPDPKQLHIHETLRNLNYLVQVHDNEIRAIQAVINIMETARLSKEGHEILDRARSKCVIP